MIKLAAPEAHKHPEGSLCVLEDSLLPSSHRAHIAENHDKAPIVRLVDYSGNASASCGRVSGHSQDISW